MWKVCGPVPDGDEDQELMKEQTSKREANDDQSNPTPNALERREKERCEERSEGIAMMIKRREDTEREKTTRDKNEEERETARQTAAGRYATNCH